MRKLTHDEISAYRLSKTEAAGAEKLPIYALLDNIRSLYNVGSIFRTSDGALVRKLYLCGYTPTPPRREISKTALGSTDTVTWEYYKDPRLAMKQAKAAGAKICVLEHTTESKPYFALTKSDFPLCLVVGNEITGVSQELIAEADMAVEIPMHGMKQSLNVAVAFGIAVFELARIWRSG